MLDFVIKNKKLHFNRDAVFLLKTNNSKISFSNYLNNYDYPQFVPFALLSYI